MCWGWTCDFTYQTSQQCDVNDHKFACKLKLKQHRNILTSCFTVRTADTDRSKSWSCRATYLPLSCPPSYLPPSFSVPSPPSSTWFARLSYFPAPFHPSFLDVFSPQLTQRGPGGAPVAGRQHICTISTPENTSGDNRSTDLPISYTYISK